MFVAVRSRAQHCPHDVRRVSAGRDREEYVAAPDQVGERLGEDGLIATSFASADRSGTLS
jgi:hypothetical protein